MTAVPHSAAAAMHKLVQAIALAPHGCKSALVDEAAACHGVARQTILKWVKTMSIRHPRKRRSDAGNTALTRVEAEQIAAALKESLRKNGKQLLSIGHSLDMLRANDLIRAERTNPDTGEIVPLSNSAISRGLRAHGLHPDTLLRAAPAVSLASRHPNHVWQIDASICVLYYLKRAVGTAPSGLQVMDADVFYKNKPANVAKIEQERVWRYAITDHASGHIYVEYVLGAESGENLCHVFINALQKREGEPVHGVPLLAMLDPGSANTGALFQNLCRALQVRVQINLPGNPRAKGQVEKAHDQIEKTFEAGLKFVNVESLDALNAAAAKWRRWFNGTHIMRRHGMTRYQAWLRITATQLLIAPEVAVCRELATSAPESRTVTDKLQVSYRATTYDVSMIPDVQNGNKLMVCRNPWRPEGAQVVTVDADGREVYYVIEAVGKDAYGFDAGAIVIGERYARHADTPAQTAAKDIEKLAMGEATLEGAAAARKGKRLAFGGTVDPWKHMDQGIEQLPAFIGKRGTVLETPLPGVVAARSDIHVPDRMQIEAKPMNAIQIAGVLSRSAWWSPEMYLRLQALYPEGALEADLDAVAAALRDAPRRSAVA